MKSSHSILTKMKLFKRYVLEAVKRAEVTVRNKILKRR